MTPSPERKGFSDKDIEMVKINAQNRHKVYPDYVLAILARLSAAEACIDRFWKGHTAKCRSSKNLSGGPSSCLCKMGDLYMEWLRSKGESE